jgi:lysophospholipase L1-like esterase
VAAAGALSACEPKPAPVVPDTYVAIGDSGSAGPLIPMPDGPLGCLRSDHNFAHLAASRLPVARTIDRSCSGATTDTMRDGQQLPTGESYPSQLDFLDARTKVVTVSIGSNDIGMFEIFLDCAQRSLVLQSCQSAYPDAEIQRRIDRAATKLRATYEELHRRAPNATVYATGGLTLLPASGPGCYPLMPLLPWDMDWARASLRRIDEMRRRVAAETGVVVADVTTTGHDACQAPDVRWVEPLVPGSAAASGHANAAGHRALADALVAAVRQHQGG